MLNVALPKGRLGEKVLAMFEKAGYECPAIHEPGRKLIFENPEKGVRYFWVKPSDVAIYVERGAADIGVAGKDILLEYKGAESYARFALSDDSQEMLNANDNKPCWFPYTGPIQTKSIPTFSRYTIASGVVTRSLDFGTPQEVDIPGVSFANGSALYSRAWALYMADRLDKDTKVLRCHVNFEGIQVGGELLRRFFWYEGSLWVLSKISNYSLTTWDPVECEFVQVKDPSNYTTNA